jgi:hypothetical protein
LRHADHRSARVEVDFVQPNFDHQEPRKPSHADLPSQFAQWAALSAVRTATASTPRSGKLVFAAILNSPFSDPKPQLAFPAPAPTPDAIAANRESLLIPTPSTAVPTPEPSENPTFQPLVLQPNQT